MPSLASVGTAHMRYTDTHTSKTPIHIKIIDKPFTKILSRLRYASLEIDKDRDKTKFRNISNNKKTHETE